MQTLTVKKLDGREVKIPVPELFTPEPAVDHALNRAIDAIHSVYWAAVETTKQCNRGKGTISAKQAKREEKALCEAVEMIVGRQLTKDERKAVAERINE